MQNARQFGTEPGKKRRRYRFLIRSGAAVVLGAGVAGCAAATLEPGRWEHPDRPRTEWKEDRAQCFAFADRRAGEALEIRTDLLRRGSQSPSGGSIRRLLAQDDAKRQRAEFFRACMEGRGYVEMPGG